MTFWYRGVGSCILCDLWTRLELSFADEGVDYGAAVCIES